MKVADDVDPVCKFCRQRLAVGDTPTWQDRANYERSSFRLLSVAVLAAYCFAIVFAILAVQASRQTVSAVSAFGVLRTIAWIAVLLALALAIFAVVRAGEYLQYSGGEWAGVIVVLWICQFIGFLIVYVSVMHQMRDVLKNGYPRKEVTGRIPRAVEVQRDYSNTDDKD